MADLLLPRQGTNAPPLDKATAPRAALYRFPELLSGASHDGFAVRALGKKGGGNSISKLSCTRVLHSFNVQSLLPNVPHFIFPFLSI